MPNRVPAPSPRSRARREPDWVRATATQASTKMRMSGAPTSQAWTGTTSRPLLGPTRVRNTEIPTANTPAAIQSKRAITRWLISAPKKEARQQ